MNPWFGPYGTRFPVVPLREHAELGTGHTPSRDVEAYWQDCTIPWVTVEDIRANGVESFAPLRDTRQKISQLGMDNSAAVLHPAGTVMLSRTASIGFSCVIGRSMATTQAFVTWTPHKDTLDSNYLLAALRVMREYYFAIAYGATHLTIYFPDIKKLRIPLPPIEEQTRIAKFLDYETAKIDALIEKQQRLIALLKEKRQAVISHAVTKGLNPTATMLDSGIEWLGEVPAHWTISKFGYVSSVVRGGSPRPAGDPSLFDGDFSPWVTVAEITKDDEVTLFETATFLTKKGSIQSRVFKAGTLLLSNSGATLGVPKILMIDANANDGVVGFEGLRHHSGYCYYYLSSLTENLRERMKQGSGQPNLNTDIVKAISLPIPPSDETEAIVRHIDAQREKFNQLAEKAGRAIELLQERRSALISAAVTGKIDVRDWRRAEKVAN